MAEIGFDVDGVIYRFTKAYHSWLNQSRGMSLDLEVEALSWDWFLEWETKEQFCENLHNSVDAKQMYWTGELYESQIAQNLHDLKAAGHNIHIVTARTFGKTSCALEATKHFFKENNLVYDTMLVSKDKTVASVDIFLEDNLANYDALEAAGIASFLINRPYNLVEGDNRRCVSSVDEFTRLILEEKWQSLQQSCGS